MKKQYKTGKTQREAIARYQAKTKGAYTTISITMKTEQAQADRATLKAYGTTPAQVWRAAIERLNAEPLPNGSTDTAEPPTD